MSKTFILENLTSNHMDNMNLLEVTNLEESYYVTTMNYITLMKEEVNTESKKLYKTILESDKNVSVINEGFSEFFEKVKEIIDKFLKFIKSLVDKFIIFLYKFVNSDKFIKKHKSDFSKFTSVHEFDYEGYEFTFNTHIPAINALRVYEQDFIDLKLNEPNATNLLSIIAAANAKLSNELQTDFYDKFRKEVIDAKLPISQSEYSNELFCTYRNNQNSKETITVDSSIVNMCLQRFENYKEFEKSVKKTKSNIETDYEKIKKNIQHMIYRNYDNDGGSSISISTNSHISGENNNDSFQVAPNVMTQIDIFIKAKVNQVTEMSSIHALAFSYKLDAIKDCYKQDKAILYKALNKMASNRGDI